MDCYGTTQNLPTEKRKFGLLCNHNTREKNAGRGIKLHAFLICVLNGKSGTLHHPNFHPDILLFRSAGMLKLHCTQNT